VRKPTDPAARARQIGASFAQFYRDADHRPDHGHPGMHRTDTVDYAIVLEGELTAIMDHGETAMRAGDILIQRGTPHAWANRSGKPSRIAFILIDGKR
jgi:quercetin dioxygenase-like cupin family protein